MARRTVGAMLVAVAFVVPGVATAHRLA